jgi:uncharacterized protein
VAPPTDADLAAAARGGDRAAFGTLVERHQPALLRTCRRAPAPLPLEAVPEPAAPGPEERDDGTQVLAAIAGLPSGQRDAVALFYLADLSHVQIAARLGISVGAVKTRLHKARAALEIRLADLRKDPPPMLSTVTMHVADIRDTGGDDPRSSHVVVLEERDGARRLPIWIDAAEATSLAVRLHDVERPRPDTYRFAADLFHAAGAQLREVQVIRLAEMIFYAEAVLEDGTTVDARPSDAINLALVAGAPVLVDEAVLAQASDSEREIAEELAAALASPRDGRAIADELRSRGSGA